MDLFGVGRIRRRFFLLLVLPFDNLLISVKVAHWQARLLGILIIRLVVPRSITPPIKLAVIKRCFTGIEHLPALSQ